MLISVLSLNKRENALKTHVAVMYSPACLFFRQCLMNGIGLPSPSSIVGGGKKAESDLVSLSIMLPFQQGKKQLDATRTRLSVHRVSK